jgi:hypothetical protein
MSSFRTSRRELLKAAALGGASVALGSRIPLQAASAAEPDDGLAAFEGALVDLGSDWLAVDVGSNDIRKASATPDSSFWRGQDVKLSEFRKGDDVLVRTRYGAIDRAWDNLDRLRGHVIGQTKQGYEVEVHNPTQSVYEAEVVLADYTQYSDNFTGASGVPTSLPNGTGIDVIGLTLDTGSVLANLFGYTLPDAKPEVTLTPGPDSVTIDPLTATTTYTYHGCVTWFYCGNGAGRCAACDTSKDHQCAWPHWADNCNGCTSGCCHCSGGCKDQVGINFCGKNIDVHSQCQGTTRTENAIDCGPCQRCADCNPCVCGNRCEICNQVRYTPVVDLTRPSFALFYDPDHVGHFPGHAEVTV